MWERHIPFELPSDVEIPLYDRFISQLEHKLVLAKREKGIFRKMKSVGPKGVGLSEGSEGTKDLPPVGIRGAKRGAEIQ